MFLERLAGKPEAFRTSGGKPRKTEFAFTPLCDLSLCGLLF
jgi:hypothetical protein